MRRGSRGARAVAAALTARQRELGLSQQDLVVRSGVSAATLRKMQTAVSVAFRPQTLARVSEALDWPPDALDRVAEGGPPPASRSRQKLGARERRVVELLTRLPPHEVRAVERLLEELVKGPFGGERGASAGGITST